MRWFTQIGYLATFGVSVALAQAPGGGSAQTRDIYFAPPENTPAVIEQATSGEGVIEKIDAFLTAKKLAQGVNKKGETEFFIATGVGAIQASPTDRRYAEARINAYKKALLDAKKQMVQFIGTELATNSMMSYTEPNKAEQIAALQKVQSAKTRPLTLEEKAMLLMHEQIKEQLKAKGVNMNDSKAVKAALPLIASTEQFKESTSAFAKSLVQGLQVFKVFEVQKGDNGELGIVCVWSDALNRMAGSMAGKHVYVPDKAPKKPIIDQVPTDPKALLGTFGIQQKIDENGKLVLVSFGQASPRTSSTRSVMAAYSKAKLNAMGDLRKFAGEAVVTAENLENAESTVELMNAAKAYENEESFNENIETQADKLNIKGLQTLKRWKTVHPLTGKVVVGTIVTWSPDTARAAEAIGAAASGEPEQVEKPEPVQQQQQEQKPTKPQNFENEGQTGDMDAF